MRKFSIRFTVRRLMLIVALAAVPFALWSSWFSPVRQWQRAINDDQDGPRRWWALTQIWNGNSGTIDRSTALATLIDATRSPSFRVRETAVTGLGQFRTSASTVAPVLIEALSDPEAEVRRRAAAVLLAVLAPDDERREDAIPELRKRLGDDSRAVREQAAVTLAEFGHGPEALPVLLSALRQTDNLSPSHALWAIGRIGPPVADEALPEVQALAARVESTQAPDLRRFLRVYAAEARVKLGDRDGGFATLQALADGNDVDLAGEARKIMAREGFEQAGDDRETAPAS